MTSGNISRDSMLPHPHPGLFFMNVPCSLCYQEETRERADAI